MTLDDLHPGNRKLKRRLTEALGEEPVIRPMTEAPDLPAVTADQAACWHSSTATVYVEEDYEHADTAIAHELCHGLIEATQGWPELSLMPVQNPGEIRDVVADWVDPFTNVLQHFRMEPVLQEVGFTNATALEERVRDRMLFLEQLDPTRETDPSVVMNTAVDLAQAKGLAAESACERFEDAARVAVAPGRNARRGALSCRTRQRSDGAPGCPPGRRDMDAADRSADRGRRGIGSVPGAVQCLAGRGDWGHGSAASRRSRPDRLETASERRVVPDPGCLGQRRLRVVLEGRAHGRGGGSREGDRSLASGPLATDGRRAPAGAGGGVAPMCPSRSEAAS